MHLCNSDEKCRIFPYYMYFHGRIADFVVIRNSPFTENSCFSNILVKPAVSSYLCAVGGAEGCREKQDGRYSGSQRLALLVLAGVLTGRTMVNLQTYITFRNNSVVLDIRHF